MTEGCNKSILFPLLSSNNKIIINDYNWVIRTGNYTIIIVWKWGINNRRTYTHKINFLLLLLEVNSVFSLFHLTTLYFTESQTLRLTEVPKANKCTPFSYKLFNSASPLLSTRISVILPSIHNQVKFNLRQIKIDITLNLVCMGSQLTNYCTVTLFNVIMSQNTRTGAYIV